RVSVQVTLTTEPVLQHLAPGVAPLVVPAQSSQGHTQITGGKYTQFLTKTAAGPPVVGDRHNGCDIGGDSTQRGQGGMQAMPPAQSDHPWRPLTVVSVRFSAHRHSCG